MMNERFADNKKYTDGMKLQNPYRKRNRVLMIAVIGFSILTVIMKKRR